MVEGDDVYHAFLLRFPGIRRTRLRLRLKSDVFQHHNLQRVSIGGLAVHPQSHESAPCQCNISESERQCRRLSQVVENSTTLGASSLNPESQKGVSIAERHSLG